VVAPVIARAVVGCALALPWLTVLSGRGIAGTLAHALALAAAFHGAGLIVAWLARQPTAGPLLVIQWGAAAMIGLSGLAIVTRTGTLVTHTVLVFAGVAVHSSWLGMRFAHYTGRVEAGLAEPRSWLVPTALLVGVGTLLVLGAGSGSLARPFDDEGHVLAQLRRLLDTGTLGDPVGYPRRAQLGAQVALAAIASGAGDGAPGILEPLALVLALGLAVAQIRARAAGAALWSVVLVVAALALALAPTDPLPCWTAVGFIVALYVMLGEDGSPPALPLAITAGALIALRYELAPIAAVAVIAAWWRRRHDHHRTAILIGSVFAIGFPYLVTRMLAWRSVPLIAHAQLAPPPQTVLVLRLVIAAAIAAPAACVLRLVLPDSRAMRTAATATAVALGALAAHVTSTGLYAMRLAWPIAIAFTIILVIELARRHAMNVAAVICSLVLCILIYEGREAPGRLRWSRRMATAATSIEYLMRPPAGGAAPYADLLAAVPAGATIAVWVSSPEQLDYARHHIIDLRTPIGARLRRHRWGSHASRLESLVGAVSASYLLLEADAARTQRAQASWFYRQMCRGPRPSAPVTCADDLEVIALRHPVVARRDNLQLVDLRR